MTGKPVTKTRAAAGTNKRQPGGVSRAEKRHSAILNAALKLFLEKGYADVSMDDIIRVSGGSKATLYKQFGNKQGVLAAVVDQLAGQMLEDIQLPELSGSVPAETLRRFGVRLCDLALSEMAIRQHRLAVSNANVFPEAANVWFESGPNRVMVGLADYLARETAAGQLKIRNPMRAAHMFSGMIMFYHNMRRLVGLRPPSATEIRAIVDEAVEMFVRHYQA